MQIQEKPFVFSGCVSYISVGSQSFSEKEKVGLFVKLISVRWVLWAVAEAHPPVGRESGCSGCSAEVLRERGNAHGGLFLNHCRNSLMLNVTEAKYWVEDKLDIVLECKTGGYIRVFVIYKSINK